MTGRHHYRLRHEKVREYHKQFHANKSDNLDEIYKFLERYQEEINWIIQWKSTSILNLHATKIILGPNGFSGDFYSTFKKKIAPILKKKKSIFQENRREHVPTHSLSPTFLRYKNQKKITRIENFRAISFMDIVTKILKIFTKSNPTLY